MHFKPFAFPKSMDRNLLQFKNAPSEIVVRFIPPLPPTVTTSNALQFAKARPSMTRTLVESSTVTKDGQPTNAWSPMQRKAEA
jgi:hypothetical protein